MKRSRRHLLAKKLKRKKLRDRGWKEMLTFLVLKIRDLNSKIILLTEWSKNKRRQTSAWA